MESAAESQEKSTTSHTEGESLSYVGRTTEDLYSVYLQGISQRSQPQQQQQQQQRLDHAAIYPASYSNAMLLHAATNNAANYQNFARGYLLPEPFYSFGFQQHPSLTHRALIGNLRGDPLPALPPRVLRLEGTPIANDVSDGGGSTTYIVGESSAQGAAPHKVYTGTQDMSCSTQPGRISHYSSDPRITMISQGNINFQGENFMVFDTPGQRYTVYDNKYEEIGLPMDPHIRAFLASNANGNRVGGSTSNI